VTTRLAVLGSPISHSKSPLLHAAAYRVLGLDWRYETVELTGVQLEAFVDSRDDAWLGLSLTMPLKRDVLPLLDVVDPVAELTGAANTLLFDDGQRIGFNTDVFGIVEAFRAAGVGGLSTAQVLGGGATAASAIVALAQLGALGILVSVRNPRKVVSLIELGEALGVDVVVRRLDEGSFGTPDAVVSTLPGHSELQFDLSEEVRRTAVLFDVAYDPWPSPLALQWDAVGGRVISGIEMLVLQALAQVRVFVNGDPDSPLDDEPAVLAAMRAAVGL
jgi:shikimate dehydrogenase